MPGPTSGSAPAPVNSRQQKDMELKEAAEFYSNDYPAEILRVWAQNGPEPLYRAAE